MIDRRAFIQTLAVTVLSAPLSGEAQPPAKVPRIGFLSASSPSTERPRIEAFQQGLRKLGYIERQNIVLEYRWAEGKFDRLAALATELVRLRVAVMVAGGELAIRAAKNATLLDEAINRALVRGAMDALIGDLGHPLPKLLVEVDVVDEPPPRQEVAAEVFHPGLDFALRLRISMSTRRR